MQKSIFEISKMDCPSEENLIRMKLSDISEIKKIDFDIPNRKISIFHINNLSSIEYSIEELKLRGKLLSTTKTNQTEFETEGSQRKLLWTVLLINFIFFIIEISTGLISKSMGLVADSLDMLTDSFVYGISIFAIGGTVLQKKNIAKISWIFLNYISLLRVY